ncbi:MAG: septum formation protein Maf [Phenylobacterium zucineum]|nr:MAG: septum formation protein Maf [Phenylobacterium zucineum]
MTGTEALILASKSAARTAVLQGAGLRFETLDSRVDEDATKMALLAKQASPKMIAEALAQEKALAVSKTRPGLVIGADQTLEFAGGLYDKVSSLDAARERLNLLRGQAHQLHSAVVLARNGQVIWQETVTATLTMRDFSDTFLETYLEEEGAAALGSVGCYRMESLGVQLFSAIDGDYFTILGLPLMGLLERLRAYAVLTP